MDDNVSNWNITIAEYIAIKFMVPSGWSPLMLIDPRVSPLAPPCGQNIHISCQIAANLWTNIGTDNRGTQRMNPPDFGYHLSFPLAPPWGWLFRSYLKYLISFWMIWLIHSWSPDDENNFGDPLNSSAVPSSGQNFYWILFLLNKYKMNDVLDSLS